ncbi:MAG: SagB/ThcOx family dehydrogenase [Nitrospirota bacterium]
MTTGDDQGSVTSDTLTEVIAYHQATKHHLHAYARGPGHLDWATQPDPFRRYAGATLITLEHVAPTPDPRYEPAFVAGHVVPQPFTHRTVSQLFSDSLALSAWKQAGDSSWALRINPSSGNLHPTEGYLICGPIEGLCIAPMVCHYAPAEHALERRAEVPLETWQALTAELPSAVLLIGLTSVHWREAWKYGERAYRYCQHDVGHAMAAVSLAAAGLGWQATLLDDLSSDEVAALLGVGDPHGAEAEDPDCVLAVYPQGESRGAVTVPSDAIAAFASVSWHGRPNPLSPDHVDWPIIDRVSAAARKPPTAHGAESAHPAGPPRAIGTVPIPFRHMIFQRRSAVAFDGRTGITREAFYQILGKTLAGPGQFPFTMLPWTPRVHLALFVHRVQDLDPGLYLLVREPGQAEALRAAMKPEFAWERPAACPDGLPLYRLLTGDARQVAEQVSCHQAIAADGCFALGMIAEFERPLQRDGAWAYPRLFWETGIVGQVLYLEAEATGIRGTGIGCFFDDPMHRVLGLTTLQYQSLYHFTLGGPVDDPRLRSLPPYPAR